jgi:hypothetical protein
MTRPVFSVVGRSIAATIALLLLVSRASGVGTWTPVTRQAPASVELMILLSDGTVMCASQGDSRSWYKLTPDSRGSYVNGTWTTLASMAGTVRGNGSTEFLLDATASPPSRLYRVRQSP